MNHSWLQRCCQKQTALQFQWLGFSSFTGARFCRCWLLVSTALDSWLRPSRIALAGALQQRFRFLWFASASHSLAVPSQVCRCRRSRFFKLELSYSALAVWPSSHIVTAWHVACSPALPVDSGRPLVPCAAGPCATPPLPCRLSATPVWLHWRVLHLQALAWSARRGIQFSVGGSKAVVAACGFVVARHKRV